MSILGITEQNNEYILNENKSLTAGETINIEDGKYLIILDNSTLTLSNGSTTDFSGGGKIVVKNGGYLQINPGGKISNNGEIEIKYGGSLIVGGVLANGSSGNNSYSNSGKLTNEGIINIVYSSITGSIIGNNGKSQIHNKNGGKINIHPRPDNKDTRLVMEGTGGSCRIFNYYGATINCLGYIDIRNGIFENRGNLNLNFSDEQTPKIDGIQVSEYNFPPDGSSTRRAVEGDSLNNSDLNKSALFENKTYTLVRSNGKINISGGKFDNKYTDQSRIIIEENAEIEISEIDSTVADQNILENNGVINNNGTITTIPNSATNKGIYNNSNGIILSSSSINNINNNGTFYYPVDNTITISNNLTIHGVFTVKSEQTLTITGSTTSLCCLGNIINNGTISIDDSSRISTSNFDYNNFILSSSTIVNAPTSSFIFHPDSSGDISINQNITFPAGSTFTIPSGKRLEIDPNFVITNEGIIVTIDDLNTAISDDSLITSSQASVVTDFGSINPSIICFRGDTQIKTSDGYKNIENLKRGDMVMTNAGAQPLAKLSKGLPTSMIKIPKDLLAKNVPNRDVIVCPWHPLSVKILTSDDDDEPEFLHMLAGELEIFDEVKKVDEGNAAYNLILDKHHEVDVGGMKFLSHHPNHDDGKHPRLAEGEEIDASKRAKKVYVSKDGTFVNYKGTTIKDLLKQKPENMTDKEYLASVLRFN